MPIIKIQTNDGETFRVDSEIVRCSGTIEDMLQLADPSTEVDEEEPVPLTKLDGPTWLKVYQWATYHKDDPAPNPEEDEDEQEERRRAELGTWDAEFVRVDQPTLFNLLNAANFLNIKPLLDVLCKCVVSQIKGKTPEQIRQMYGIVNDFSPEEEAAIRRENEWCAEK